MLDDKQFQQLKIFIDESNERKLTEAMATWEHSRETISSNFIQSIFNGMRKEIREEINIVLEKNEQLTFLRKIGDFWSVSGWFMKGVIYFSTFIAALTGILIFISKILRSVDK